MRDLWNFYWPLIKKAPLMAVSSTDRTHSVGLIIAFLIFSVLPVVSGPLAHWASIGWQGISPWWSAGVVGTILIYGLAEANRQAFLQTKKNAQQNIDALIQEKCGLRIQIQELQAQLQPK